MKINEKTPAVLVPITLDEAKTQCRISGTDHDAAITAMVKTATRWVQRRMNKTIMTTTWELYLDAFTDEIPLPYPPVKSVKVFYKPTGVTTYVEMSTGSYYVDNVDPWENARVALESGQSWPDVNGNRRNCVKIEFVAGETTGTAVAENIKHAVKMVTAWLFDHRGDEGLVEIPTAIDDIIFPESNICV